MDGRNCIFVGVVERLVMLRSVFRMLEGSTVAADLGCKPNPRPGREEGEKRKLALAGPMVAEPGDSERCRTGEGKEGRSGVVGSDDAFSWMRLLIFLASASLALGVSGR